MELPAGWKAREQSWREGEHMCWICSSVTPCCCLTSPPAFARVLLHPAAKQQHALLCFLAMLGGVLALNGTRFAEQWPRAKWAVLLLAAANGLVGVALQLQGGMGRQPHWMQALPWGGNAPGAAD